MRAHSQLRRCRLYRGRGDAAVIHESHADARDLFQTAVADRAPICSIMAGDLVCAAPDLEIGAVLALLVGQRIGCLPVVDEHRRPTGVITKFDIVEQIDAAMRAAAQGSPIPSDLPARIAEDVMMPIALSLDEHATISHAAAMMKSEDTHHVLVVDDAGALIGVVSAKDIVRWVVEHDALAVRRDASGAPPYWRPLEG